MATAAKILKSLRRSPLMPDYIQNIPCGRVTETIMCLAVGNVLIHSTRYHVGKLSYRVDSLCAMGVKEMPPMISVRRPL